MTLHLRGIHDADQPRADVLASNMMREQTHEQLRAEVEAEDPMLRWPLHRSTTNRKGI